MGQASGRLPLVPCLHDDAQASPARPQNPGASREGPGAPERSSNHAAT